MNFLAYFQFVIAFRMCYAQFMSLYGLKLATKIRYSTRTLLPDGDLSKIEFMLRGENITLNLTKSILIGSKTPVWLMKQGDYDVSIEETDPFTIGNAVQFYVDEDKNSTIAVSTNKYGEKKFMGIFGRWFINPLRGFRSSKRKLRSINQTNVFSNDDHSSDLGFITDYHMISQMSDSKFLAENIITIPFREREYSNSNSWEEHIYKRRPRDVSKESTVHPGILIIADYNIKFSSPTESRFYNFLMYIVVFWNSVDLRFRGLQDPRIRLHISGIIVAMKYKFVPFFQSNLDGKALKVGRAKDAMGDWLFQNKRKFPIESYNIAVAMTNLTLCLTNAAGNCESTKVTGMATFIGATCTFDWSLTVKPIAIINDYLDFSGILRATHEIGHLLGANHDGSRGNEDCDDSNDNVMATTDRYEPTKHIWSKCSQRSISKFLKSTRANCLRDMIPSSDVGDSILHTISLLDQCNLRGFTNACDPSPETCSSLECHNKGWAGVPTLWSCVNVGPALEGSPCGIGFCHNNSCIPTMNPVSGDFGSELIPNKHIG